MQRIRFSIHIPTSELLRYYQGHASQVLVIAEDGRRIRFPIHHLRPFVEADGISGRFEMQLDRDNRCQTLSRLA